MLQKLGFGFCLAAVFAGVAVAQSRTVTNFELDRYKQQRIKAEQDLRDNYARLGFPSPEVLQKRNEESQQALIALSERLRNERLERERLQAEREAIEAQAAAAFYSGRAAQVQPYIDDNGVWWGTFGGGFGRGRNGRFNSFRRVQEGYFAAGQFWPTGPRTPVRPLLATPRVTGPPHH